MTAIWSANKTWAAGDLLKAADYNQYIRDNLDWLKGRPWGYVYDFDGTVFTTTSSSFQAVASTDAVTTTGGRVLVLAWGTVLLPTASGVVAYVTIYEDGANKGDATEGMASSVAYTSAVLTRMPFCLAYVTPTAPTPGDHEWKIYIRNSDNANTVGFKTIGLSAFEIGV